MTIQLNCGGKPFNITHLMRKSFLIITTEKERRNSPHIVTSSRLRFEPGPFCARVQHANHLATYVQKTRSQFFCLSGSCGRPAMISNTYREAPIRLSVCRCCESETCSGYRRLSATAKTRLRSAPKTTPTPNCIRSNTRRL